MECHSKRLLRDVLKRVAILLAKIKRVYPDLSPEINDFNAYVDTNIDPLNLYGDCEEENV